MNSTITLTVVSPKTDAIYVVKYSYINCKTWSIITPHHKQIIYSPFLLCGGLLHMNVYTGISRNY